MTDTTDKALDALQKRLKTQEVWGQSTIDTLNLWHKEREEAHAAITALRAQLTKARADALRKAHERLWDKLGGQCRLEACDIVEALIYTPSAPNPEAVARAALEDAAKETDCECEPGECVARETFGMKLCYREGAIDLRARAKDPATIAAIITKAGGGE
jgi:hypothetical protein